MTDKKVAFADFRTTAEEGKKITPLYSGRIERSNSDSSI